MFVFNRLEILYHQKKNCILFEIVPLAIAYVKSTKFEPQDKKDDLEKFIYWSGVMRVE